MKLLAILIATIVAAATGGESALSHGAKLSPTGRIVGGVATTIEEVPYQVSFQVYGSHICGGSIISENWVLTAAHCMVYSIGWYSIRAGSTRSNRGGSVSLLTSIKIHEEYATNSFNVPTRDIALARVNSAFVLDSVRQVIPLFSAEEEAPVGSDAVITGWGATREGGSGTTTLQTVTIPIISKFNCNIAYAPLGGIPDGQICAAIPQGGKDACQGDSGGPLAINGRLAGVVSWGNGCARPGFPGVYTEVAAYRNWIATNSGV